MPLNSKTKIPRFYFNAKVQKKKDRHGKQFAYANIYSSFGLTEAIIWHSQLKEYEDLIVKGKQVAMYCKKDSTVDIYLAGNDDCNFDLRYID